MRSDDRGGVDDEFAEICGRSAFRDGIAREQHGFRQAANIKRCIDAELTFYAIEVFRVGLAF